MMDIVLGWSLRVGAVLFREWPVFRRVRTRPLRKAMGGRVENRGALRVLAALCIRLRARRRHHSHKLRRGELGGSGGVLGELGSEGSESFSTLRLLRRHPAAAPPGRPSSSPSAPTAPSAAWVTAALLAPSAV